MHGVFVTLGVVGMLLTSTHHEIRHYNYLETDMGRVDLVEEWDEGYIFNSPREEYFVLSGTDIRLEIEED